jgi:hypothetical protein
MWLMEERGGRLVDALIAIVRDRGGFGDRLAVADQIIRFNCGPIP